MLAGSASPPAAERIVYETRPNNCVQCVAQTLTVAADGRVTLETRGGTEPLPYRVQTSSRSWQGSPAQVSAYRAALQPYRPESGRIARDWQCELYITHYGAVVVTWRGEGGQASVDYDLGCSGERVDAMREAIERAPTLLGLHRQSDSEAWQAGG